MKRALFILLALLAVAAWADEYERGLIRSAPIDRAKSLITYIDSTCEGNAIGFIKRSGEFAAPGTTKTYIAYPDFPFGKSNRVAGQDSFMVIHKGIGMTKQSEGVVTAYRDTSGGWLLPVFFNRYRGFGNQEIIGVSFINGKLYVEYRENYSMDDMRIYYRDIYGVVNGKIALLKTIEGKTIPAQPERVEWPEEK